MQNEIATVGEIMQMVNTLHALNQQISRLTAENQQFRQTGLPGLAEIATAARQAATTAKCTSESTRHQGSWKTSNAHRENPRDSQEDHGVSDCFELLSFRAGD